MGVYNQWDSSETWGQCIFMVLSIRLHFVKLASYCGLFGFIWVSKYLIIQHSQMKGFMRDARSSGGLLKTGGELIIQYVIQTAHYVTMTAVPSSCLSVARVVTVLRFSGFSWGTSVLRIPFNQHYSYSNWPLSLSFYFHILNCSGLVVTRCKACCFEFVLFSVGKILAPIHHRE